jgi:hypothetical protein
MVNTFSNCFFQILDCGSDRTREACQQTRHANKGSREMEKFRTSTVHDATATVEELVPSAKVGELAPRMREGSRPSLERAAPIYGGQEPACGV